jgi:hypothetical protein
MPVINGVLRGVGGAYDGAFEIPDRSVTRVKLEYPTDDVSLAYLAAIDKAGVLYQVGGDHSLFIGTADNFIDKAFESVFNLGGLGLPNVYHKVCVGARVTVHRIYNSYLAGFGVGYSTADFGVVRYVGGVETVLGAEAIDIGWRDVMARISVAGSTIKAYRDDMSTPKVVVTDTTIVVGSFGAGASTSFDAEPQTGTILLGRLRNPTSPAPPAIAVLEVTELSRNLVEIRHDMAVPDFLKYEKKRYDMLRSRGYTDEEIELLFGKMQTHIDIDAVSWGAFEFSDESPSNVVVVVGDNPYIAGAVERQVAHARRKILGF